MAKRIREDHSEFRDIISGKLRNNLKKFVTSGRIFRHRANGKGQMSIPIPKIDQPHVVYGKPDDGVGRGEGKKGDVIQKDPEPGQGQNGQAGQESGEGMMIGVDMEEIVKMMGDELKLPKMKPKSTQTYEEVLIRYNNISKVGPMSLLHRRRTIRQCMRRMIASGEWDEKKRLPGYNVELPVIKLNNDDFRYRQWNEIKKPSSNAVIFFARDGSGSMDQYKCDIVSDMAWWLDMWIRKDYKKTERLYVWHDTEAKEVSEDEFYKLRYGGGTMCSSSLKLIQKIIKHRFPPEKYNIYIFYFGDGENWGSDNKTFCDTIKQNLNTDKINMIGITQVIAWNWENSVKQFVDKKVKEGFFPEDFIRTTAIGGDQGNGSHSGSNAMWGTNGERTEETDEDIKKAMIELLGNKNKVGT
jgi:uncharacterized sporulation protein YeaH/YhbH (DUF444 family)